MLKDKDCEFTAETLWKYQVEYYKQLGAGLAPLACAKLLLLTLTPQEVDFVIDSGIINQDDVTMDADFTSLGSSMKLDPKDLINKAKGVCRDPELLKKIVAGLV